MNPPSSPLRLSSLAAVAVASLLLSMAPLRASQAPLQGDLKIKHRQAEGMVSSNAEGPPDLFKSQEKGDPIQVRARDGQKVVVRVVDANTLLFDYKLGASTDDKTADRIAIDNLVKLISPDVTKATTGGAGIETHVVTVGGKSIAYPAILADLKAVGTAYQEIPKRVSATATNPPVDPIPAEELKKAEALQASLKKVGQVLDFFKALDLAGRLGDKSVTIETKTNPTEAPTTTTKTVTEFFADERFADLKTIYLGQVTLPEVRDAVSNFEKDYNDFREKYHAGWTFTKTADNSLDRKQVFDVTARTTYVDKLDDAAKAHQKKFAGSYTVIVSPVQKFHVRAGLGAIYSFVENPTFGVATSSTGVVTVTKKDSDPSALAGAATVNLYHDSYWGEPIEPFVQFGYSPKSSYQGILGGVGLTAFKNVQFSAGVIYQQRNALKEGQSVGMVLPKAEDLGTRKEWATGFYVQVSLGITVGK